MTTLLSFNSWWGGLSAFVKAFYIIAVSSSLILLIQLIIAMFGFGDSGSSDMGDSSGGDGGDIGDSGDSGSGEVGAGLRVFTVQTVISFLVTFGWSGVAFGSGSNPMPWPLAFVLALIIGSATLLGVAKLMQFMMKLQSSGNIDVKNAIGLIGEVYIPVPANEGGMGKVNVTVQGRFGEYNAVTKDAELLKTGTFVKVVGVADTTLIVEKHFVEATDTAETINKENEIATKNKKKKNKENV